MKTEGRWNKLYKDYIAKDFDNWEEYFKIKTI